MNLPNDGRLLRIYIGEADRFQGKPLYEAIVLKAREMHIAGATVLRGVMGFGPTSRLHTAKLLAISEDLPLVIEIIDQKDRIDMLMPIIEKMVPRGLVTMESVQVLHYRAHDGQ